MSRQPTWDTACSLQAEMFKETAAIGGLDVQLIYFRGFGECRASRWVSDPNTLADLMVRIDCRGGHTQIRKVLARTRDESRKKPVQALVYIGDCMARAPIGFGRTKREGEDEEAITRMFSPEFRNRLDATIAFGNLPPEVVAMVVDKFVLQLEAQLSDRGVTIELTPDANTCRPFSPSTSTIRSDAPLITFG